MNPPRDLSVEALAKWCYENFHAVSLPPQEWPRNQDSVFVKFWFTYARAVRELIEAKVEQAVVESQEDPGHIASVRTAASIVNRIMGRA